MEIKLRRMPWSIKEGREGMLQMKQSDRNKI